MSVSPGVVRHLAPHVLGVAGGARGGEEGVVSGGLVEGAHCEAVGGGGGPPGGVGVRRVGVHTAGHRTP